MLLLQATGMQEYEAAIAPLKQALFSQLFAPLTTSTITAASSSSTFNVLEVGIGTGPNFPFYPSSSSSSRQQQLLSITGLEPNPAMWQYTQQAAEAAGLSKQQLQLVAADAQQMPFEPNSFDAAVVTLVGAAVALPCTTCYSDNIVAVAAPALYAGFKRCMPAHSRYNSFMQTWLSCATS
jgi:SAM-dependent methyltransferase